MNCLKKAGNVSCSFSAVHNYLKKFVYVSCSSSCGIANLQSSGIWFIAVLNASMMSSSDAALYAFLMALLYCFMSKYSRTWSTRDGSFSIS